MMFYIGIWGDPGTVLGNRRSLGSSDSLPHSPEGYSHCWLSEPRGRQAQQMLQGNLWMGTQYGTPIQLLGFSIGGSFRHCTGKYGSWVLFLGWHRRALPGLHWTRTLYYVFLPFPWCGGVKGQMRVAGSTPFWWPSLVQADLVHRAVQTVQGSVY